MNKIPVTMPLLSDTMKTGRLARWLKQPGDAIKTGDVLAEVESDKAIMEIEAYNDGYLVGPLAPVNTDIPVKSTIAWIADEPTAAAGAGAPQTAATDKPAATSAMQSPADKSAKETTTQQPKAPESSAGPAIEQAEQTKQQAAEPIGASTTTSPVVAAALSARQHDTAGTTPFVRALAAELEVDLDQLGANDAQGHISAARVVSAALGPQAPQLTYAPPHTIERPSAIKSAMAENMMRSVHTPTFHITIAVDLKPLHDAAQAEHESLSLLLARACALSVQEHPEFNACWTPGGLARRERIDIAIAVDTPDGLITPVLRDVLRPLGELNEDWRGLKGKLAKRRLKPEDYSGATFYLSNLGLFPGIEQFDAIVPTGAAAILAVAAPSADGLTRLTLSCDHRVVAGADAARFLTTLNGYLASVKQLV